VSLGCAHNHLKRNALNLVFTHIYCSLLPWQRTYLFAPRWDFRRFPPLWYHFPIRGLCFRSCLKPCVNYLRCFLVYPVLAADETPLSFAHLIFRALSPPAHLIALHSHKLRWFAGNWAALHLYHVFLNLIIDLLRLQQNSCYPLLRHYG